MRSRTWATSAIERRGRARAGLVFGAGAVASLAVFVPLALARGVVRDEGFYLVAAQLVAKGRLPYLDFFYPQTPFLPYLYGAWLQIFGFTWVAARMLSALAAAATGGLICAEATRREGPGFGMLALVLYLTCDAALSWFTVVKPYAVVSFLVLAAVLATRWTRRLRPWTAPVVAGFCLGLAANSRLVVVAAVPVLAVVLARQAHDGRSTRTTLGWFAAGLALALAPDLPLMATGFAEFWFDNLGYHLIRSDDPTGTGLAGKLEILGALGGFGSAGKGSGLQLPLLLWAGLVSATLARTAHRAIDPALWTALVLFVAHLLPSPAYVQYFSILVPLLILPAVALVRQALAGRAWRKAALAVLAIAYVARLPAAIAEMTTLRGSPGANARTLAHVVAVREAIDAATRPGDAVYSSWPGFLFGSHAVALGGTENQFGVDVAAKLDPVRRRRYHVMSDREIAKWMVEGRIAFLALPDRLVPPFPDLERGYRPVGRAGGITIFARRERGSDQ